MNVGTLTIYLGVTTAGINKAIRDVNRLERNVAGAATSMSEVMLAFSRSMIQFVTFPVAILGSISVGAFSKFESNLAKVTGLVGIAADQTQQWGNEIKTLSSLVGVQATELSEALYFITTGGIRGIETMEVMEVAAKGAAAGLGETKEVADLIISAMNAYGKENLSAARAADILVASVREGKAEANALAQSMGIVLPIASKLGVGFDQVGAAMAAMTRTGTKASTAAMQTRQMLNKMVKPAKESEEAIKTVGLSFEELRATLQDEGLLPALIKINEATKEYGIEAVAKIFPNIRALAGVLDILGANLENNIKSQEAITNSTGALNHAFEIVSGTVKFKLNQFVAEFKVLLIEVGEAIGRVLIPMLSNMVQKLRSATDSLEQLTGVQQQVIVKFIMLATVVGPVILLFNIIGKTIIIPLVSGLLSLVGVIKKAITSFIALALSSEAFVVSSTKMVYGIRAITGAVAAWMGTNPVGAIMLLIGAIAALGIAINKWIQSTKNATLAQRSLNEASVEAKKIYLEEKRMTDSLIASAKNEYATKDMRIQAIRRLNELSPVYLRGLTEQNIQTKEGEKILDNYNDSLIRQAEVQALSNKMIEIAKNRIDDLSTGMDHHLTVMQKLWANYQGFVKTMGWWLIPNPIAMMKTKEAISGELIARGQKAAEKAAEEYGDAMESVEGKLNKYRFTLQELNTQYGLIEDNMKSIRGTDTETAKSWISNAKLQLRYAEKYLAYLKETNKIKPTVEYAYPKMKGALPKAVGGKGWIYEFFQLDRAGEDVAKVEMFMNAIAGAINFMTSSLRELTDKEKQDLIDTEVTEFWNEYRHQLEVAERALKIFGNSYDIVGEKIKINQKQLMGIMDKPYLGSEEDIGKLKLLYTTYTALEAALKRLNDELKRVTDTNDSYMKSEMDKRERLDELTQKYLAASALYEAYTLQLANVEKGVGSLTLKLEDLKELLEVLNEWKFLLPKEMQEGIEKMLAGFSNLEEKTDVHDFNKELENLDNRIKAIGNNLELWNAKLDLLRKKWRALLTGPIEDIEKWKNDLRETAREMTTVQMGIEAMRGMESIFESLGESIGKMAAGAENAFQGMLSALMSVVKEMGKIFIKMGASMVLIPGMQAAALKYLLAGTAIIALASAIETTMERSVGMVAGGIVPPGYPNDTYPARLTSGEMVIPPKKLPELVPQLVKIELGGKFEIKGRDLVYVVNEENRRIINAY